MQANPSTPEGKTRRLRSAVLWFFALSALSVFAQELPMKIRLHVNSDIATATLVDNATTRDFVALLPLTITLVDFAKVERIGDLPRKLSTVGAPIGMDPVAGDITYYAPWNNLTIFAGDNVYADGLVRMGKVATGLAALQRSGPLKVRIERIQD
ncbi:cyclophilin-like fold protein [Rhodoferax sp. OV413]|uniref:cyclophilin-like fold protein n=1 Tax=Rhodoferax sp. OV413 TaxID=1855285 RepID=UPI000B8A19BC|nr:cyclophilin-like fold protein [Rhodoferax sp. OV413]